MTTPTPTTLTEFDPIVRTDPRPVLVVAYGMGVDSTAMLIGLAARGIRPAAILFADTGGEKPETYAFRPVFDAWLAGHGMPAITVVRNVVKDFKHWPPYHTLEENCLTNGTLPSVAFRFQMHSCSLKWKAAPQHKWLKSFPPAVAAWARGEKVVRAIGFDASPGDQRRRNHAGRIDDPRYAFWYPLQDWGWDRDRCKEEIRRAGLPVPPKSSCFFCPAMKPHEVRELEPNLLRRIVVMEARAEPRLKSIQGLWANGCKGTRGSVKKPGRMSDYIAGEGLLPSAEVERLRRRVPLELLDNQERYAAGEDIPSWPEFFCGLNEDAEAEGANAAEAAEVHVNDAA
jgi:hypothetical protein